MKLEKGSALLKRPLRWTLTLVGLVSLPLMAAVASAQYTAGNPKPIAPSVTPRPEPIADVAEAFDEFGAVLARGDFNGDHVDDLAIGVPWETIKGIVGAGAVNVIYGTEGQGLTGTGNQIWKPNGDGSVPLPPVEDLDPIGDLRGHGSTLSRPAHFGSALAAGDFNCDGWDDLAIGAPYHDTEGNPGSRILDLGYVAILYGSREGLTSVGSVILDQMQLDGDPNPREFLGAALTAGNFNGDRDWDFGLFGGRECVDLAIGVPGDIALTTAVSHYQPIPDDFPHLAESGGVNILLGSPDGLGAQSQWLLYRSGAISDQDEYGASLAAGDFDGDSFDDLAIGSPGQRRHPNYRNDDAAGRVELLFGSPTYFAESMQLAQRSPDGSTNEWTDGGAAQGDRFGSSVAFGDFNDDGWDDLVVGAPGEDVRTTCSNGVNCVSRDLAAAGAISVFTGNPSRDREYWGIGVMHTQFDLHFERADTTTAVPNLAEANDQFGSALTVGDFDGDGVDDLAVSAPNDARPGSADAGSVAVLRGQGPGIDPSGGLDIHHVWLYHQNLPGLEDGAAAYDRFGRAIAAGDFDGDGFYDLAVGVPHEDLTKRSYDPIRRQWTTRTILAAGAVNMLHGSAGGPMTEASQFWHQDR